MCNNLEREVCMDEFQREEEFLFEENEENIVIKYKLLRSLIIKHYNRGCKFLEIAKVVCTVFFIVFTAAGLIACSRGANKAAWLILWIIIIFLLVNIFLITDYTKYLVKSKVIPYLEDDNQVEFGEYSIFFDDDEEEDEEDKEYEKELEEKKRKKAEKKELKKQKKNNKKRNGGNKE